MLVAKDGRVCLVNSRLPTNPLKVLEFKEDLRRILVAKHVMGLLGVPQQLAGNFLATHLHKKKNINDMSFHDISLKLVFVFK